MKVAALKVTPEGIFKYRTVNQLDGLDYTIIDPSKPWVEEAAEDLPDVVHLSYAGSPDLLAELTALRAMRGVPFVVDCDDYFLEVPEYNQALNAVHPASPAYRIRVAMLKAADAVTVSTETLRRLFKRHLGIDAHVVPNFIRPAWFDCGPILAKPPGLKRILFTGASGGRWGDLEFIRPVLSKLAAKPDISILIFGTFPKWALEYPRIHAVRWVPADTYFPLLRHLNADINLAPLLPNDFNRCKSAIKYYESAMAGAVGVYSRLDPYACVADGETGLTVPHDADAWYDAITRLLDDVALRRRLRYNAMEDVSRNHAGPSVIGPILERVLDADSTFSTAQAATGL